ncbi:protein spinster homolog 1-like [Eleutherodactylus coqui]|uniref:protein spinster homolog 1-like n=1 Tax=Eleutherodactylus coqui TaxID=57060 RepID=UPI00346302AB
MGNLQRPLEYVIQHVAPGSKRIVPPCFMDSKVTLLHQHIAKHKDKVTRSFVNQISMNSRLVSYFPILASFSNCIPSTSLIMDEEKGVDSHPHIMDEDKPVPTYQHGLDEEMGESAETQENRAATGLSYIRCVITLAILTYTSLVIYMNRYITAGVLPNLQSAYNMSDSASGLLSTAFICSYMLLAPVYGYLGDRYNRKYIMCAAIAIWSSVNLCLSFIPNKYFLLLAMRGLVGAVESSFTTIGPSIIADLFVADKRSRMLSIFYLTIPAGSGLGYIVGDKVTSAAGGNFRWALRITPGLGLIAVLLMVLFTKEPSRGAIDAKKKNTSPSCHYWVSDMKKLFKNQSFIFSSLGNSAGSFIAGALGLWAPTFLARARTLQAKESCQTAVCSYDSTTIFGALTVVSGVLGVVAGAEISKKYQKGNPRADPLVCACGMLCSAPFLFLALILADISLVATYAFIFIGSALISLRWAVLTNILLYIVPPKRRSTAQAMQITLSHLLGDAGSPYIIGAISELIQRGRPESTLQIFRSLEYALMTFAFVVVIGGASFLATAIFIEKDRKKAEMEESED